jgi:hypothetical protein
MSFRKLDDWLTSYLEFTKDSEPPELYHIWTGISTIAACLQRKCFLQWGSFSVFPNLYIVLVGPPGRTRKGTAMAFGKSFLQRLQVKTCPESITREALIRELKNANEMLIEETTGITSTHSSLTVYSPELVVFLGYNQQQLVMDLTDLFDCGNGPEGKWTYRTKTQGSDEIFGVWLNLMGATTPTLIRNSLCSTVVGGGLASRMIFVYQENKRFSQAEPIPLNTQLGEDLYYDLETIRMMRGQFKVTPDFIKLWKEYYDKEENPFQDQHLAGYWERRGLHTFKISMTFSASRSNDMIITVEDLEKAIALLRRTEKKMSYTFTGVGDSPHAVVLGKLMQYIGTIGREVSETEIKEKFILEADFNLLGYMLKSLKQINFITERITESETYYKWKPKRREDDE